MNRREFLVVGVMGAACAGATAAGNMPLHPIVGLAERGEIPEPEFGRLLLRVTAPVPEARRRALLHRACRHDGMYLDGLWTGCNFPRDELTRHIVEWSHALNRWEIPARLDDWRWGGRQALREPEQYEWSFGLWHVVRALLEMQPLAVRLAHANAHARRMGRRNIWEVIDDLMSYRHPRPAGENTAAFVRVEMHWFGIGDAAWGQNG